MEEETIIQTFTPQVAEESKPKVGQEFETINAAYEFYNTYAKQAGFSARMSTSKKRPGTDELVLKQFVCYKEGQTDENYQKKFKHAIQRSGERNRGIVRVGCKAKLTVVRCKSSPNWIVSSFVESHNHAPTTPSRVHLLRSHRHISNAKKALVQQLSEANVSTSQQISLMEIEYGGPQNIGCTERDIRNYERDLKEEMKGIDAESLIKTFALEKEKNPGFYFDFEKNSEDRLVRCFWADSYSRRAYNFFGDVVVFDTTYNTNRYGMIFAPLIGVNHHSQTIIFGCGFLSDETIESFVWLLNQWMIAMPKGAPQMIITDQDPAMTRAIAQVLPNTFHRYCIWHIQNKFSEKLNTVIYRDNYHLLRNIILNTENSEEFETSWMNMLQLTKLEDNDWLCQIYEIRNRWVPAFVQHIFAAGMSSSQRAESSHAFFKRYISKKNSLMDFIIRFNRALGHQRYQELMANHCDINEQPRLKSLWPMEAQMAKIFTRKVFQTFQDEIFESQAYIINTKFEDEASVVYTIARVDESSSSRCRKLDYNKFLDIVSCSCKRFECEGIPCRHMLAYFRIKQILQLPIQYILQRWTKRAKIGQVWDKDHGELNDISNQSLMSRHSNLSQLCSDVVDDASLTEEGANILRHGLEDLHNKIKEINIGNGVNGVSMGQTTIQEHIIINEPPQVRAKGCGKRLKKSKEKTLNKERVCHGCGLRGQSHDKRNCPTLLER